MKNESSIIVVGALNTDIIATGIREFPKTGQLVYGKELKIGAGGKSRNIAQMIATLTAPYTVAMIGKTSRDSFNLWKVPLQALKKAKVNTDYIHVVTSPVFPGIALIPVDEQGNNQIFVLPGITSDFAKKDIDAADKLFQIVQKNTGYFVITLELPFKTALAALKKANQFKLRILFDPGGITPEIDWAQLFNNKMYLIKPNEHEAKILTGIDVNSFTSAQLAAKQLLERGVENVLITVGKDGAYFFNNNISLHFEIPKIKNNSATDETGCGDQTIAAITAFLSEGKSLEEAIRLGIIAGSLQFQKQGIQPITKKEIMRIHNL